MLTKEHKPTLDIIVLNYNGWHLLKECLPSVIKGAKNYSGIARVYVLDNDSSDNSVEMIKLNYPEVEVIQNSKNEYMFAYNAAVKKSNAKYVMLLNNDIRLSDNCIDTLMKHFMCASDVFAVQPLFMEWDNTGINGGQRFCHVHPRKGFFEFGTKSNVVESTHTLSASGSCIYDREKFLSLGGYDELYYPAYYEDSDLSWKAWDQGWKSIFEPNAVLWHRNHATLDKTLKKEHEREVLIRSNQLVFMWRHMNELSFWFRHIVLFLPRVLIWDYRQGRPTWTKAAARALTKIPGIVNRRRKYSGPMRASVIIKNAETVSNC